MKIAIILVIFCLWGGGHAAIRQCCPNDTYLVETDRNCENATKQFYMGCSSGHFTLFNYVLDGFKLTTLDTPGFIIAEDPNVYCLTQMKRKNDTIVPVAIVCFEPQPEVGVEKMETNGIMSIVSAAFLLLTFAVYLFLPKLRDLQGKCLMCMCLSEAIGFFSLGIVQLGTNWTEEMCKVNGFMIFFWLMANFVWMNIVSINLYRNTTNSEYLKRTENKQFFYYCCYGWGFPIIWFLIILTVELVEGEHLKPGFGITSCWFQGTVETWVFFYGPIAILLTSNVILFVMIFCTLWIHNKTYEVSKLNILKSKFFMGLKLFLVMGISWVFEIASFAHGGALIIWDIMDTVNCLQGVIFFLVLVVFRKRALKALSDLGLCTRCLTPLLQRLNHDDSEDMEHLEHTNGNVNLD